MTEIIAHGFVFRGDKKVKLNERIDLIPDNDGFAYCSLIINEQFSIELTEKNRGGVKVQPCHETKPLMTEELRPGIPLKIKDSILPEYYVLLTQI